MTSAPNTAYQIHCRRRYSRISTATATGMVAASIIDAAVPHRVYSGEANSSQR